MRIKRITTKSLGVTVGKIYDVEPGVDGFCATIESDNGGVYYLNGKDELAINIGSFVIAEFEVVEK